MAFEYLYDNYSPAIYNIIFKIVKSQEVAEDLLQDAFVKIWENIASYDNNKGRLFTWMLNISRNLAIDKIRSLGHKSILKSEDISENVYLPDNSFSEKNKPEYIGLKEMLDVLTKDEKFLIDLMYFKGYTQSEIAKEYDIPLGTIKSRVKAAVKKLRNNF